MDSSKAEKPPRAKPPKGNARQHSPSIPSVAVVTVQSEASPADFWGHSSLYLISVSFVLFIIWQRLFHYSLSAGVVLPVIGNISVSLWAALIHSLGGWLSLSIIVSLEQPGKFVRNLLRPLYAIEDEYIRRLFRHPVAFLLATIVFLVTALIVFCNISIEMTSRYEVMVCLPSGHGRSSLEQQGILSDNVRLRDGEPARVLLRGWNAREIIVIRDRYNLTTLDAIELQRSFLGFRFSHLSLRVDGKDVSGRARDMVPAERLSAFHFAIQGTLSYSERVVLWAVIGDRTFSPGQLLVGEPEDGPEDPPDAPPDTALFFKDLWASRELFSKWTSGHQPHFGGNGVTLQHPTSEYNNRILYKEGLVPWRDGQGLAKTKEAILVISKRAELPGTDKILLATIDEMGTGTAVIGLLPLSNHNPAIPGALLDNPAMGGAK